MQRVLTVPGECVAPLFESDGFYGDASSIALVLGAVARHGEFRERQAAEADPGWKQIVAAAVVRRGTRVLSLRRARSSPRASLRLRHTVLFGGHVDESDAAGRSAIVHCVRRELTEEIGVRLASAPRILGVVADAGTEMGRLHLGVIFDACVETDALELLRSHDRSEFVRANKRETVPLVEASEVCTRLHLMDPWSKLLTASAAWRELVGEKAATSPGRHSRLRFG